MSEGFSPTSTTPPTYTSPPTPAPSYGAPSPTGNGGDSSTTDVAKDQAGAVAQTAKDAGANVAGTVTEQAGAVAAEAGQQAKQLFNQARSELTDQAATQQQRVAGGLHALADELHGMAQKSDQEGPVTDLARAAAGKAHDVASWLDGRDPGSLIDEVRAYARRSPGAYLAIALGAGVLAGRLTRGLAASGDDSPKSSSTGTQSLTGRAPAGQLPVAAGYPAEPAPAAIGGAPYGQAPYGAAAPEALSTDVQSRTLGEFPR